MERIADRIDPYSKKALQATYDKLELQAKIEDLTKGKPWHRLTPDEKAKMYKLERDKIEDARADAVYAEGAKNRKLARDKAAKEAEAKIVEAQNSINKQKDAERDRKAERKQKAAEAAAEAADKKQAEKDARAAEKQAKKDAKAAEKAAERDAKQQQAEKEARAAEKQAKKDAKAEADARADEMAIRTSRSSGENALLKRLGYDAVQRSARNGQTNVTADTRRKDVRLGDSDFDGIGSYSDAGKAALTKLFSKPTTTAAPTTTASNNSSTRTTTGTSSAVVSQIRRMTKMGNKTYAEIASQLGVSESTVKNYARGEDVVSRLLGK
jgi:hypothetical protein